MKPTIKIISWNVRGLNCLYKRGNVNWVFVDFLLMLLFFLSLKWKVNRQTILSLWGRRPFDASFHWSLSGLHCHLGFSSFGAH